MEKVANVSIINYTGVLYATLAGFFIFNETYNAGTIGGMSLVVGGVILSMLVNSNKSGKKAF
jgi:drug/metabolite transporter (DMT)-like permease